MNFANLKVIVFDFDGTLIDSQKMKLESFYDLFPPDHLHQCVVSEVLCAMPEESRYIILSAILDRTGCAGSLLEEKVKRLAQEYDRLVMTRLEKCREMPGATSLLIAASEAFNLYLSSNTPQQSLEAIVRQKCLLQYFKGISGYPQKKDNTLLNILKREKIRPEQLMVVGDGLSDQQSADKAGCSYYAVNCDQSLLDLAVNLNLPRVTRNDRW